METTIIIQLLALGLLLVLSACFSSCETCLFSLSSTQLQQMRRDRNPRIQLIDKLLSEPRRLIATILIGNEFVNVSASVLSASIIIQLFGADKSWLNIVIMVPALLLFGEITPKTLAYSNNVAFATFQSFYIDLFARIISPLRTAVRIVSEFFINRIVKGERSQSNLVTEDMVRSLTNAALGEGSLDSSESRYIHKIFDFGNKTIRDLMIYRSQMVSVNTSMPLTEILDVLKETRHSKLPVFDRDGESLVGVLFARDVVGMDLLTEVGDSGAILKKILRKPYLVPASGKAMSLFRTMRKKRGSLALVTDEFGGIIGLVTLDDLLQCIFGDLPSSSDDKAEEAASLGAQGNGIYRITGSLTLAQFNTVAGTKIKQPNVNTVFGLITHLRGELPAKGDIVETPEVIFTVNEVSPQRILVATASVKGKANVKDDTHEDDDHDDDAPAAKGDAAPKDDAPAAKGDAAPKDDAPAAKGDTTPKDGAPAAKGDATPKDDAPAAKGDATPKDDAPKANNKNSEPKDSPKSKPGGPAKGPHRSEG